MDTRTQNLVAECERQQESCKYTSASLHEWLKSLRLWKRVFIVTPIVLGAVAAWPLLSKSADWHWLAAICSLLAGLATAVYKALDFDQNLDVIAKHAHAFKALQDRFRLAAQVTALGEFDTFRQEFDGLLERLDAARAASLTSPERFFEKAKKKIESGHYDFAVDDRRPDSSA